MSSCPPCTLEYSRGNGTGVAEAIGNWGFSNQVASPSHELSRMQCLLDRMENLREQQTCSRGCEKPKAESQVCVFEHSPPECRPSWMFPAKRPLITYCSVGDTLLTSNRKLAAMDALNPIPGRSFAVQGNDKWYRLGPVCCPQPSCPAPYCPQYEEAVYCCNDECS